MELARGSVGARTWGCVFAGFAQGRATAELAVGTGDKALRVVFHGGAVVAAWSPLASDSAARVGMTLNMVTSTQVAELTKRVAAAGGRDEIEVIAEALRLAPELAHRMRRRTIALRAARTFAMEGSPYVFDDRLTLPYVPGGELDARGVLYLGARTHLSAERLARDVRALGGDVTLTQELIDDLPQFGFGELELPVVAALRGGESVEALVARSGESERRVVHAVAYALASWIDPDGGHASPDDPPLAAPPDPSSSATFRTRATSAPPTTHTIPPPNASRLTPVPFSRTTTPPPLRSAAAAAASLLSQVARSGSTTSAPPVAGGVPAKPGSQPRIASPTGAPAPAGAAAEAPMTDMEKAQREAIEAQRRGEAALRREQFALAIEEFLKASQANPRNGIHAAYLAWSQFCAAPDKRAVASETRRALERAQGDTEEPTPQLFLGRVERMMGRQREALRIFREILDLHPGHTEAQSEARVLEQRLSRPK